MEKPISQRLTKMFEGHVYLFEPHCDYPELDWAFDTSTPDWALSVLYDDEVPPWMINEVYYQEHGL